MLIAVFSPSKIQCMMGGRGLGGAYNHIKAFELHPIPISKNIFIKGLLDRCTLSLLGRTHNSEH